MKSNLFVQKILAIRGLEPVKHKLVFRQIVTQQLQTYFNVTMVTVNHSQTEKKADLSLVDFCDLCLQCLTFVEERRRVGMTTIQQELHTH